MAFVDTLFNTNFLEYASYVIKDRAIPHIRDGLKPVQRRILHTLHEIDDGKFHKVANVVGQCMKYHPHGDASITSALVVLANKDLFIDKQGNFGNIYTGDQASAARYIECRLTPCAKAVLFNPPITEYEPSYDGRNKEPITLPSKIPVLLIQGAEGIAVGMATKILPHNFCEVIEAEIACLEGEQHLLFPDFPTGGFADVSDYNDGNGKILVRAKLDTRDPKRIVIRELPFGSTTESLIASVEQAAKKNKIKIAGITDYTAERVEIEVRLARGVHTADTVDALYAFTDCEMSLSTSLVVIRAGKPTILSISDVVQESSNFLLEILKAELTLEQNNLLDKLHAKTLERIFIEHRIYKNIEEQTTREAVVQAVFDGLQPYLSEISRAVTAEDVEHLLTIPIRRISLYDINKAKKEIRDIHARLKEIRGHLANLTPYAIQFLQSILADYGKNHARKTELIAFEKTDVKEAAQRNLKLRYDGTTGYIGYEVTGTTLFDVSQYDRILIIRKSGAYSIGNVPDKLFVDKGMLYCGFIDKETAENTVFSLVFKDTTTGYPYLKRCRIVTYIMNRGYSLVPENGTPMKLTTDQNAVFQVDYKPKPRVRVLSEEFSVSDFLVKGTKANGVRLAPREVKSVKWVTNRNALAGD